MPLAVKVAAILIIGAFCCLVGSIVYWGVIARSTKDPKVVRIHKRAVNRLLWYMLPMILGVELCVWAYRINQNALYWPHIIIANAGLLLLMAIRVHLHGHNYPVAHRYFAYSGVACGAFTALTGALMFITA